MFGDFLYMIGESPTSKCGFCGIGKDSAQHTLQHCVKWDEERSQLKDAIGNDLNLQQVVSKILLSRDNWTAFVKFCEVMIKKENKEREEENLRI